MEKQITITVNGVTMTGTPEALQKLLSMTSEQTEENLFYNSNTKGTLYIPDMDTAHIYNALRKIFIDGDECIRNDEVIGLAHELYMRAK